VAIHARFSSMWRNLFHKARVEADLHEELDSYLQLLAKEKEDQGMSPDRARRAARLELGGMEHVKENVRHTRAGAGMETLIMDLRHSLRMLRRSPGFAVVAILVLALGIGANTAIYSVIHGVLLRPLPYPDSARLVLVSRHFAKSSFPTGNLCIADYLDWKTGNHAFEDPTLLSRRSFDLTGNGSPEEVAGAIVTTGFFSTFRVQPILGRTFRSGEDGSSTQPLAVLSEELWRRRFGANPEVIGQAIALDGKPTTVIGVVPGAFHFPSPQSELWTNLHYEPPTRRGPFFYRGIGRLKPGVSFEQAQAELNTIARQADVSEKNWMAHLTFPAQLLRDAVVGQVRPALLVLFGAVSLVLLIAVVNVANLLLARSTVREREMALRLSLGASRRRLLRQLLTESALLALLGGSLGVAIAAVAMRLLPSLGAADLPRFQEVSLDYNALAFTLLISLVVGVLFGIAPALQGTRANLAAVLRESGKGSGGSRQRTRAVLVVAEIALSLLLLVGAGLFLRSLFLLQQVKTFTSPPDRVLTMQISANAARYGDSKTSVTLFQQLLDRVSAVPGVESAAVSDSLPPDREGDADTYVIEGRPLNPGEVNPITSTPTVSAEYFRALGIPLLRGRVFDQRDSLSSPTVTIISDAMARRDFPGQNPVGKRLKASSIEIQSPYMEIIGVVGNTRYLGLSRAADCAYYQAFSQNGGRRQFLTVRSHARAAPVAALLRREIQAVDHDLVITHVETMEQSLAESLTEPRLRAFLLGLFAFAAIVLAAIGVYGVIAYSAAQRTHEIGVRMALGARRSDVIRLVVGQGAYLALAGILTGVLAALSVTRLLADLLFGVSATDPATFALVSVVLALVALTASYVPARRASHIAPQIALKGG
jgi:predicted permease